MVVEEQSRADAAGVKFDAPASRAGTLTSPCCLTSIFTRIKVCLGGHDCKVCMEARNELKSGYALAFARLPERLPFGIDSTCTHSHLQPSSSQTMRNAFKRKPQPWPQPGPGELRRSAP